MCFETLEGEGFSTLGDHGTRGGGCHARKGCGDVPISDKMALSSTYINILSQTAFDQSNL